MMNKPVLQILTDLKEELNQSAEIDDVTVAQLKTLSEDIERIVSEHSSPEETSSSESDDSLLEHLEASVVRFEGDHPTISGILRDLIVSLERLGI